MDNGCRHRTMDLVVRLSFLLLILPLLPGGGRLSGQTGPYHTRNVFIVVIDGIRNQEAFESGNLNMRFIWDSLRHQGTVYARFMNRGITVTNSGHSTIVSGARQLLPNNSGIATPIRPREPTLGEYYRRSLGVPAQKVYYISGKNTIWRYPVSLYPGYGYEYSPTIKLTSSADATTWDSTRAVMDRDHPSLCYVLFAHVDAAGHTGDTANYLKSIRTADSLTYLLWKKIQADSLYRDQTTMIVTSDHGRHDDRHGGWTAHGDYCHGCRHIPFLAVGPDIKADTTVVETRDQIDIAPTVGELLGFPVPYAQGSVMREMLKDGPAGVSSPRQLAGGWTQEIKLSQSPGGSRSGAVASTRTAVHVLYSEAGAEGRSIAYRRSSDRGEHWDAPQTLFSSGAGAEYLEPVIAALDDSSLYAAAVGYLYVPADTTYRWVLNGRRSTDGGVSWSAPPRTDTLGMVSQKPSISAWGRNIIVSVMNAYKIVNFKSTDGGLTFDSTVVHGVNSEAPSCAVIGARSYLAWHHLNSSQSPYWNVLFDREPWQHTDYLMTNNDTSSYSYDPSIAREDSAALHLAYAHLSGASGGNQWRIMYRRDTNLDGLWSEPLDISPGRTGFEPLIRVAESGRIYAVWADYHAPSWGVWGSYSTDQGATWAAPFEVSTSQPDAARPAFDLRGDTMDVVWQDTRDGTWEVYFRRLLPMSVTAYQLTKGWNMVSVPLDVADWSVNSLFPMAASQAFMFNGTSYETKSSMSPKVGYWLKAGDDQSHLLAGMPRFEDTVDVAEGWNLLGSIAVPLPVSGIASDPPGLVTSEFFTYDGSYIPSDTVHPGKAYWVKALTGGGRLFLTWQYPARTAEQRIRVVAQGEYPPQPPSGEIADPDIIVPQEYFLTQNYPNPFNPQTTIRYGMPGPGHITLRLFDVLGRVVATILEADVAAGVHGATLDAGGLASGTYFLRMEATSGEARGEAFVQVNKLTVLR